MPNYVVRLACTRQAFGEFEKKLSETLVNGEVHREKVVEYEELPTRVISTGYPYSPYRLASAIEETLDSMYTGDKYKTKFKVISVKNLDPIE
jgi:hypothetical protein